LSPADKSSDYDVNMSSGKQPTAGLSFYKSLLLILRLSVAMAISFPDLILRRSSQIAERFYTCKNLFTAQVYFSDSPYLEDEQKRNPVECLTCQGEEQQYGPSRVHCLRG
jgi:hypothetical protein